MNESLQFAIEAIRNEAVKPEREIQKMLRDELWYQKAELDFVWKWIDRMARGELSHAECLSALTHYPGAPDWVFKTGLPARATDSREGT